MVFYLPLPPDKIIGSIVLSMSRLMVGEFRMRPDQWLGTGFFTAVTLKVFSGTSVDREPGGTS